MTREAVVVLLLLAALAWVVAHDPGVPMAGDSTGNRINDLSITPDPWATVTALAHWWQWDHELAVACLDGEATQQAFERAHPCLERDDLNVAYMPGVYR